MSLAAELTAVYRLALAYAPARTRGDWMALLVLDARLERIVGTAREPLLAQIRLAWWRERLRENPTTWPAGEPLLAELARWGASVEGLVPLVDGWEALLDERPFLPDALAAFVEGRAGAFGVIAKRLCPDVDVDRAADCARRWTRAELASRLPEAVATDVPARAPPLPRALRPLAVLTALARHESAAPLLRLGAAIRAGMTGR